MDISIVILNYKSKELALSCLKSIYNADFPGIDFEVIVVDNDSGDQLGEEIGTAFPRVRFIQNNKNVGMGAGNNIGVRQAKGRYIVIMNPDTVAERDVFFKLFSFMEDNQSVGIVGPKQLNTDGTTQDSCYRWHRLLTPLYRRTPLGRLKIAQSDEARFLMKDFGHDKIIDVDWLLGSFLFCRREALDQVGFFDERFFLYFEDTDLCRRIWQAGWRVVYNPEAVIIHDHQRQSAQVPWYMVFCSPASRYHLSSWMKYLGKWGLISRP